MKNMDIILKPNQPFNLELTLCCGQVFTWEQKDGWWYGTVKGEVIKIRQKGRVIEFENVPERFVEKYFRLDDDLEKILSEISKDPYIERAVKTLKGLRLIRQDPWECLSAYICATYKSIPAIKQMLRKISMKFGEIKKLDGYPFYTFPSADSLAKASQEELVACGLGYRAKYLSETAKKVALGELNLEELKIKSYEESRKRLLSLQGVGFKVADCVLLFSLEKLEAFPVDVWIKRAMLMHYAECFEKQLLSKVLSKKNLSKRDYEAISHFGRKYFGRYAGYAQEYIYYFERTNLCPHCR
ncbi:hypothetical protein H5T51_08760 [Candidatus Bathyarchaeota archaeon]|nr:hypothetical protein [Candidatus Bathyarchaeota archaeon]